MNEYIYKTLKYLETKKYVSIDTVYKFIADAFPDLSRGIQESIYYDIIQEGYIRTYEPNEIASISSKGLSAIKNYELEYESLVALPKEANEIAKNANKFAYEANIISKEANTLSKEANKKSNFANIISIISVVLAAISLIISLLT